MTRSPTVALLASALAIALLAPQLAVDLSASEPRLTSGLQRRVPWTSSRLVGSPYPPPPYRAELAFSKLKFQRPVVITDSPDSSRLFVAQQDGKIYSLPLDPDVRQPDLVIDLKQARPELTAIYGLTFHPQVAENHYVYICYVLAGNDPEGTLVSRFQLKKRADDGGPPQIDADTEQVIIRWRAGGHNGGCLKFGPDGYLYISTGDGAGPSPPDTLRAGQDVSNLLSAILRIDVDHPDAGRAYGVPDDNPLVDVPGARPEIWSYGYRNPWKMSFDRRTGHLWVGDVGWELWEMIYRVQKGGNYGWSIMEGRQVVLPEQEPGPTPILPPTIDHPHSEAASITGGFVYRGSRLPELAGAYIYGDYQSGIIWGARMQDDNLQNNELAWHQELARTSLQLVGFGEDRAGELYLLDYQGQIFQLAKNPAAERQRQQAFPTRLSETGLFASTERQQPAAGVIPYSINAPHWADHTHSQRWLGLPEGSKITVDGKGNWQFPDGAVIAKTVSIDNVIGEDNGEDNDASRVHLETQVMHREDGSWRPYTYVWNREQTDAVLAGEEGSNVELRIRDEEASGGVRQQNYRIAGRKECTLCHNPWVEARTTVFGVQSASLLGLNAAQLNREHDYGKVAANQLATFQHIGLLESSSDPGESPRLANPYDDSADLDARARAYLHVNCSHCHQFNAGGVATIVLSHDVPLKDANLLDARPTQGAFGISDARIVAPGDPHGSVLYYRLAKLGGGRMPRLGSSEVDRQGLRLIHDWIASLPANDNSADSNSADGGRYAESLEQVRRGDPQQRAAAIGELTSSTRGALALRRLVDRGRLDAVAGEQVVEAAAAHPVGEVRDLFEAFVDASQRTRRLGAVVNQTEILQLDADAERGRQVFFGQSSTSCKNCHRIRGVGETLGPDLSEIGKKYPRDQLLQHILAPSKFIDPQYVPYLLETESGRVLVGQLQERTDELIVLRDARNQQHRIAADQVVRLARQHKSLMPDLLLRDMTAREVADLLAFLASLK